MTCTLGKFKILIGKVSPLMFSHHPSPHDSKAPKASIDLQAYYADNA